MDMKQRKPNEICVVCGKGYYKHPSNISSKCCSKACKEELGFRNGKFSLIPYCNAKKISVEEFIKQIDKMHNEEMKTIKQIAEELGARVIHASVRGYGGALIKGCEEAYGKYVIIRVTIKEFL